MPPPLVGSPCRPTLLASAATRPGFITDGTRAASTQRRRGGLVRWEEGFDAELRGGQVQRRAEGRHRAQERQQPTPRGVELQRDRDTPEVSRLVETAWVRINFDEKRGEFGRSADGSLAPQSLDQMVPP